MTPVVLCFAFVFFCFFFLGFPFVLRSGVTHGRLLLQLKLCFCRVDFLLKKFVIFITLVISLDFLLLSFCGFGEHHFDGLAFECSPKALMDFLGEELL
jgi:hypothetical protein